METERSLRNRESLLLDLLYEEAEYITDNRVSFLHNIWRLAGRKFITYDELKQNTPESFFNKDEAQHIAAELSRLNVHFCDKPPTKEERQRLPMPKFREIPFVRGIYYGPDDGETDFVNNFTESRLSKSISKLSELIADRRLQDSMDQKLKLYEHWLSRTEQQKRDLFKERLESIRAEIRKIEQSTEPDQELLRSTPWMYCSDKVDLIRKRKVEHKKLDSLWELASEYGFITYSVVKELAPERLIKAAQVNQIINFFTDLGIYVCDELPSDEQLKQLPKPHINRDYIKTAMQGEPCGVYQYDEWRFFHSFMRSEEYYPPASIRSFLFDVLKEMDRINSDKEGKNDEQ